MDSQSKMQRYRKRLKEDPVKYKAHLKKERERNKKRRLAGKESLSEEMLAHNRNTDRERQRKCREKKNIGKEKVVEAAASSSNIGSFKSDRSLKKAVTKVKVKLPSSPSKKIAVVKRLASELVGPEMDLIFTKRRSGKINRLSDAELEKVKNFFLRDDVSYQTPGRKDTKLINGVQMQLKYMVMTVGECYQLFKEENAQIKIGKSLFYASRPKHVRLNSQTPSNMCVCIYHANFEFLLQSVSEVVSTVPKSAKDLMNELCCDTTNEACMTSSCKNCDTIFDILPLNYSSDATVRWKQWTKNEHHTQISEEEGTFQVLLQTFESKLQRFKQHFYVHRTQSDQFREAKERIESNEAVVQIDFAENFTLISQDEVQSAHWNQAQATVFTACAWVKTELALKSYSYAIISDDLTHNKESVWYFLKMIVEHLKTKTEINTAHVFSDGCAAQFKNRFNLFNLCFAKEDFGVNMKWSFFASGHGKGAVDGIGATIKRSLWTAIMSRQAKINTPAEAFNFFVQNKKLDGVTVLYCDKNQIKQNTGCLKKRWEHLKAIKNIQKMHFFQNAGFNCLLCGITGVSALKMSSLKRLEYNDVYSSTENE